VGVAAATGMAAGKAAAQDRETGADRTVSARPPTAYEHAVETGRPDRSPVPDGYTEEQAGRYFVQSAGSDYMVDVMKTLDDAIRLVCREFFMRTLQVD
jgi:hypothetical protein